MIEPAPRVQALKERLEAFMRERVLPSERQYYRDAAASEWRSVPLLDALKREARSAGLWNLFMADPAYGPGLTNLEYAPLCELMGWSAFAPQVFNCSAPDTGNMDTLRKFGSDEHKARWLEPLLKGEIRSAYAMTEPDVASSDATNIAAQVTRDDGGYVINGRKWWSSGMSDPRCKVVLFMGRSAGEEAERHQRHSMLVIPADTAGITILRNLSVFGFDEAPHGHAEVDYVNVRVPASDILLGEGRGFEVAQSRLGPGRIHHCMRMIGHAERALAAMCRRLSQRSAFGHVLSTQSVWLERIAESRIIIDQARLLTLKAAHALDTGGVKAARNDVAMIKVVAPSIACRVIDWAMQAHGAAGLDSDESGLSYLFARARAVRIVDGPDEVHRNAIARAELKGQAARLAEGAP